jgi:hypothetical protein
MPTRRHHGIPGGSTRATGIAPSERNSNCHQSARIKDNVLDNFSDIEFSVGDIHGLISPWSMQFDLLIETFEKNYSNLDDLLSNKVIDGKSLNDL